MEEFGSFLGLSYEGLEKEIKELFIAIESGRRKNTEIEGSTPSRGKRLLNELKKLEWSINYDQREDGVSGGSERHGKGHNIG